MNKTVLLVVAGVVVVGGGWYMLTQTGGSSAGGTTLEQGDETIGGGTGNAVVDQIMKQNPPANSDSRGEGTVTVDGTPYSFNVTSCIKSSSGSPTMGGDGDAKLTLQGSSLILNVPALSAQYTVRPFTYEIEGQTLSGSGTGTNLAVAGAAKVAVELTATCDAF